MDLNRYKHALVEHILNYGKQKSWYEYAVEFNIKPKHTHQVRAKAANDIWRSYLRAVKKESPSSTFNIRDINPPKVGKNVSKIKEWETYSGEKRYSVEYKPEQQSPEDILKEFVEEAKKFAPSYKENKQIISNSSNNGGLLEISIFDLHLDKLAWHEETGNNYDKRIAQDLFFRAVGHFGGIAKMFKVDRILFPVGNDLFNSEGIYSQTTAGTPQETDGRWQDSFKHGWKMMVKAIDALSTLAPVDVIIVPGNHDYSRTYYLGAVLEAWYHNNNRVKIDNSPTSRKYYKYGTNLIGFTHGDQEKHADLPMIMATEAKEVWGEADNKEWHIGHYHKVQAQEIYGVTVRTLPSLCGTDAWHKLKGFIGNTRAAQAYLYSKTSYEAHFQYKIDDDN